MIFNIILALVGAGIGFWFGRKRRQAPEPTYSRIIKDTDAPELAVRVCISKGGIPIMNKDGVMEDCIFAPEDGGKKR